MQQLSRWNLATMHEKTNNQAINVNLISPIILTKYVSRYMLTNGEGRIINISSIISKTGFSGLSVYGATKGGLVSFSKSLARELREGRNNSKQYTTWIYGNRYDKRY